MKKRTRCRERLETRNLLSAAPIGGDDVFIVTQDESAILGSLLLNDADPDGDSLEIVSFTTPANGSLTQLAPEQFRYTPRTGFAGRDTFQYTVGDGSQTDVVEVIVAVNRVIDVDSTRDALLDGVREIANPVQPGKMVAFGAQATAIANYSDGIEHGPLAAAAGWGHGRVVAMPDHQWINLAAQGPKVDTAKFYDNVIAWLGDVTDEDGGEAAKDLKIVTYNASSDATYLRDRGYFDAVNANSLTSLRRELADADVFVAGWLGSNPSSNLLNETADFVRDGGGLFVADYGVGYQWWWNRDIPDAPGNRLLREAGIGFGTDIIWDSEPIRTTSRATGHVTESVVLDVLADDSGASSRVVAEAGASLSQLFEVLPPGDTLLAQLDTHFNERISSINPTPETPVSDPFEQALLSREMNLLHDLPPAEVTAHRTAEAVYGEIPSGATRVNGSYSVDAETSGWQATGFYAAPGEIVTVSVPRDVIRQGYEIRINGHRDNISRRSDWARVPHGVSRTFPVNQTTIEIANAFGGSIYIDVGSQPPSDLAISDFEVNVSNALAQPHFVLGETTNEQWQTIRNADAPYAEFVSEHVAFSVPSQWIRELDDAESLMRFWDETGAFQDYVGSLEQLRTAPERFNVDVQISVGLLHAGYPIQGPTWASERIVDLEELTSVGSWGYFHELGHQMQARPDREGNYYTFSGDVEVTVNIFANASLEHSVIDSPTGGWGYSAYPQLVMQRALDTVGDDSKPNFDDKDAYPFYFQLSDAFGWDTYRDVFQTYHDDFENDLSALPDNNQERKDQFYMRWSEVSGYDMTQYMVELWGLEVTAAARQAVAAKNLPDFLPAFADVPQSIPVARDASYTVSFDSLLSYDGVASVRNLVAGQHGELVENTDGSWTYLPDVGFEGTDTVTFEVVSSTGFAIPHTLDFEVVTNGVLLETFTGISGTSIRSLERDSSYPESPTQVDVLESFEAPVNRDNDYGARARGWVTAPATGNYRFFIASDDNGELHLSTDDSPENARRIAYVPGWTSSQEWTKFSEQRSAQIRLVEGERYYVEALMKEGGGGDNLAVAWDGPGFGRDVIPGDAIELFYEGNARPNAEDDVATAAGLTSVNVLVNDFDRDGDGLQIVSISQPRNGTVTIDGANIAYVPNAGFEGTDEIGYTIADGKGGTSEATLRLIVEESSVEDPQLKGVVSPGGKIRLVSPGIDVLGVNFQSEAGLLVPIPDGDASPFSFALSNSPTQVSLGNLGSTVRLEGTLVTEIRYLGNEPATDLRASYGLGAEEIAFPVEAAPLLQGFVVADNRIVLESPGLDVLGVNFESDAGLLTPIPNDDASPFTFALANSPEQISLGSLGTPVRIEGRLITNVRYLGDDPASDLRATYGTNDGSEIAFDIQMQESNFDCNGDGATDAGDLNCVCEAGAVDDLLAQLGLQLGDLNASGRVDFADFLIFSQSFGKQDVGYTRGDLDCSGTVDFADFLRLTAAFGS